MSVERRHLEECIRVARATGSAQHARRVAELYEAIDQLGAAQAWWRHAANLGDPDAIEYVAIVLRGL